ncbi:MAG: hypothetical protein ABSA47_13640, partial [Verrucomicrobiota bacterium]
MKNSKFILALVVSSAFVPMVRAQTDPASTNANSTNVTYAIISRDANSRQWAKIISATNAAGQVTTTTNRAYTELATGICYQQNGSGPWLDAVEQIDITADGAQATQGRHTVHWMGNVNTAGGSVHLVSPDGKDFLSMVYGLAYWDTATGSNVLIASLQDSHGQRVGSNRVVYSNAFQNLNADIEYVYNKSGLEQNIILLAQPPSPATLGLNPETSRMQVLTEFYSPPVPQIMTDTSGGVSEDTLLDFGEMKIGIGNALFFQGEGEPVPINEERVAKHWTNLEGRDFLIEEIPWSAISNAVQELPPQASTTNSQPTAVEHMASLLPLSPPKAAGAREPKPLRVAHTMPRKPGVVIDYSQMSTSATNYVFQANVTYYVSGNVNLYGASAFEGGTVIKYTNTASATLDQLDPNGSFIFESCAYRPAVFTSANDNSLADAIKGSTGSPAQGKGIYLQWTAGGNDTTPEITDARFSYAGIAYQANTTNFHVFQNCQFLNCGTNVSLSHDTNVCFYNVLAANCGAVVVGTPVIDAENITVDSCTKFDASSSTNGGITNSIFTAVAGGTNFTFTNCFMSNSGALLYLRVGAGNYYLATNASTESNGTININPALLQDLQGLTTHPPSVYSNATISVASTLGIQANREAETPGPDLGYHYAPLDYVFGGTKVNQNLTFSPGVAVGYFNASSSGYGISMANSMSATFQGSEEAPLWWVRANTVQEGRSDTNWPGINIVGGLVGLGDSQSGGNIALSPEMNLLFTHCSVLANGDEACGQHFRDDSAYLIVNATNCEFHGGQLGYGYVISCYFTNCLMDRTAACQEQGFPGNQYVVQNCTFHGGDLFMVPYSTPIQITVRDSTFDGTDILDYGYGTNTATVSYDYNAFTNSSGKFAIGGAHDQIVTNGFNWQTSWLGTFYLPSNSPLILSGDASATNYGLYHFTTQTNQAPEGDAIVDIGYHYVATDNYGNPLSTYIPGIPDYVLDANGTGVYSSGDLLDWMNPFAIYDQGVNYGGYYPQHVRLGYWKFDTAALTNQAGKAPFCSSSMIALPSWASNAVSMTTTNSAADLEYYLVQDGNWTNFDYRNGTIRFWYQPTWPSTFLEETNANYGTFFQVGGGTNGDWAVFASTSAGSRVIQFQSWSNGYMLFPICEPLYLQPNLW